MELQYCVAKSTRYIMVQHDALQAQLSDIVMLRDLACTLAIGMPFGAISSARDYGPSKGLACDKAVHCRLVP